MSKPGEYLVKFVEHDGRKTDLSLKAYEVQCIYVQAVNIKAMP